LIEARTIPVQNEVCGTYSDQVSLNVHCAGQPTLLVECVNNNVVLSYDNIKKLKVFLEVYDKVDGNSGSYSIDVHLIKAPEGVLSVPERFINGNGEYELNLDHYRSAGTYTINIYADDGCSNISRNITAIVECPPEKSNTSPSLGGALNKNTYHFSDQNHIFLENVTKDSLIGNRQPFANEIIINVTRSGGESIPDVVINSDLFSSFQTTKEISSTSDAISLSTNLHDGDYLVTWKFANFKFPGIDCGPTVREKVDSFTIDCRSSGFSSICPGAVINQPTFSEQIDDWTDITLPTNVSNFQRLYRTVSPLSNEAISLPISRPSSNYRPPHEGVYIFALVAREDNPKNCGWCTTTFNVQTDKCPDRKLNISVDTGVLMNPNGIAIINWDYPNNENRSHLVRSFSWELENTTDADIVNKNLQNTLVRISSSGTYKIRLEYSTRCKVYYSEWFTIQADCYPMTPILTPLHTVEWTGYRFPKVIIDATTSLLGNRNIGVFSNSEFSIPPGGAPKGSIYEYQEDLYDEEDEVSTRRTLEVDSNSNYFFNIQTDTHTRTNVRKTRKMVLKNDNFLSCLTPDLPGEYRVAFTMDDGCHFETKTVTIQAVCKGLELGLSEIKVQPLPTGNPALQPSEWFSMPEKNNQLVAMAVFDVPNNVLPNNVLPISGRVIFQFKTRSISVELINENTQIPSLNSCKITLFDDKECISASLLSQDWTIDITEDRYSTKIITDNSFSSAMNALSIGISNENGSVCSEIKAIPFYEVSLPHSSSPRVMLNGKLGSNFPLNYRWSWFFSGDRFGERLASRIDSDFNSLMGFDNSQSPTATFLILESGIYVFRLDVNDGCDKKISMWAVIEASCSKDSMPINSMSSSVSITKNPMSLTQAMGFHLQSKTDRMKILSWSLSAYDGKSEIYEELRSQNYIISTSYKKESFPILLINSLTIYFLISFM